MRFFRALIVYLQVQKYKKQTFTKSKSLPLPKSLCLATVVKKYQLRVDEKPFPVPFSWQFQTTGFGLIEMWDHGRIPGIVIHTQFGSPEGRTVSWQPGASTCAACCHGWEDITWASAEPAQSFHLCASNMAGTSTQFYHDNQHCWHCWCQTYSWWNVENTTLLIVCPSRFPWKPVLRFLLRLKKVGNPRTPPLTDPQKEKAQKWTT